MQSFCLIDTAARARDSRDHLPKARHHLQFEDEDLSPVRRRRRETIWSLRFLFEVRPPSSSFSFAYTTHAVLATFL